MMQAWQILCLAIALWRAGPPRPEEVEWTEHDRGLWLQLWKSETGKKVRELMARHEMTAAKSALQRQDAGLPWAAGYSTGLRAAHAYLVTLAAEERTPEDSLTDGLSEGERQVIEQYSP